MTTHEPSRRSDVAIRRATEADVNDIIAMQREAWEHDYRAYIPDGYGTAALQRWTDPEKIRETVASYPLYAVAVRNERAVGVVNGGPHADGTFEIWWIHVRHEARRLGIGRRLVEHVVASVSSNVPAISVVTFQDYAPTIAFYAGIGFVEVERYVSQSHGFAIRDVRLRLDNVQLRNPNRRGRSPEVLTEDHDTS